MKQRPEPHIPCSQAILLILLRYLQHQGSYWTQHIDPDFTEDFAPRTTAMPNDIKKGTVVTLDRSSF